MSLFLLLLYLGCTYLRPMDFFPDLAPYRIMLWLGVLCGLAAVTGCLLTSKRPSLRTPQILLMPALLAVVVVSRIAQGWLGGALIALQDFGTTAAVFLMIVLVVNSIPRLRAVAFLLVASSIFLAAQAIFGYHFGYSSARFTIDQHIATDDSFNPPPDEDSDPSIPDDRPKLQRLRSVGFLADPNDFAEALLMVLPILALAWKPGSVIRNFFFVIIPGSILLYAVYLTHSRGALVGLGIILFLAAWQNWGLVRAGAAAAIPVAAGFVLNFTGGRSFSMQDDSNSGRLAAWSAGLEMLRTQPMFGVGYNFFTEHHERTAHNSFVLCFAELGLVGYFVWLGLLVVTAVQLRSILRQSGPESDPQVQRWANAIRISFYGFLGTALFLSRTYNVGLYLLVAMTVVLFQLAGRDGHTAPRTSIRAWALGTGVLECASIVVVYGMVRVFHAIQ